MMNILYETYVHITEKTCVFQNCFFCLKTTQKDPIWVLVTHIIFTYIEGWPLAELKFKKHPGHVPNGQTETPVSRRLHWPEWTNLKQRGFQFLGRKKSTLRIRKGCRPGVLKPTCFEAPFRGVS